MGRSNKYSRIHKVGNMRFRYNYENSTLEYVCKPGKAEIEENAAWRKEFGRDLWEIVDGYVVIDRSGLAVENWKEGPEYWCDVYASELDEEAAVMADDFVKYELPYL